MSTSINIFVLDAFLLLAIFASCSWLIPSSREGVSIFQLSFSVTVPGGCHSQGCHGYPLRSALLHVMMWVHTYSFSMHVPIIGDEFN